MKLEMQQRWSLAEATEADIERTYREFFQKFAKTSKPFSFG